MEKVSQLGADGGANYRTGDWGKEVARLCGGEGPDVVIDSVGGETLGRAIEIVRPAGRIVTYGATTGPIPQAEVRRIFWKHEGTMRLAMRLYSGIEPPVLPVLRD